MKVRIVQEDLNKGLSSVGKVVTGRGQMPILGNVLLVGEKEGLTIVATNLELGMRVKVGGKVEEVGEITVPARNLSEFVGTMGSGEVMLATVGEKIKVTGGGFSGTFATISGSEFPPVASLSEGGVKLPKQMIVEIAREVAYAVATDESRPMYTGVKFMVEDLGMVVVATDGFRMAKLELKSVRAGEVEFKDGLILPGKTIMELTRIVGEARKEEVEMQLSKDSNQVIFGYGRTELISRVLEGNFPNVDKIIPSEFKSEIMFDREELVKAVRAVAIFARENSNIIKFSVLSTQCTIKAVGGQIGEGEAEIEAELEGEDTEVAFNFRYVLDYLQSVDGERVQLSTSGSLTPGVWTVVGREDLVGLIMPVRV